MSSASIVTRVAASDFTTAAQSVRQVADAAAAEDGADPLDEAALLALRHGPEEGALWLAGRSGFAWRREGALDLVVEPSARRRGLARALATTAVEEPGPLSAWSHGNHPGAAALAAELSFERVRDLWVMRRSLSSLPARPGPVGDGIDVRTFEVGRDEDAFLTLNAAAFAHHPEQGALTRAGLDERMAEPWFDPNGFFVAERGGELVGFHWTKKHPAMGGEAAFGEVYVVGVSPSGQGSGLGKRLTSTGLHHLADEGLAEVILYVEADNAPAVAVYERLGFTHSPEDTHVQYGR